MGAIEDVYADLEADVSEETFREAVEEKVEQMGGLADEETAAMLIAHELSENEVNAIADIETGMDEVKFLAKVTSIGELRTFERDGEDEDGHVINVEAADETGQVRLAFWDEQAVSIDDGTLEAGQVLRIKGRPKDGYNGLEVSVEKAEPDDDAEIDVDLDGRTDIDSLSMGQSDVNVQGIVLGTESIRTFDRDDGSEGRVANLTLGDESGRIRVTLWDDRADRAEQLDAGTPVEVVDGYVRERDGSLELHVGDRGAVKEVDDSIDFSPETDPIDGVELEQTVDLGGVVRSVDPKRTFDRDDGSEGQVRNVRIQDDTGDIRVALWGEKADTDLGPGDEVFVADAEVQDGWQDDLEASAGWGSTVVVLEDGSGAGAARNGDSESANSESSTGLDAFADDRGDDDGSEPAGASGDDSAGGEQIEVTGTVVQTGDPVIVDDGEETISVETDERVELGQQVTVRGQRRADRVEAEELL